MAHAIAMDHQCAIAPSKDMALRAPLAWHTPLQRIINVRPLRPRIWLCLRPAAARKAISLDSACMRRLHGTCHCNGSSIYDRSVKGTGFACGLRPHAKPSPWNPLARAACMAHAIDQCTTVPSKDLGLSPRNQS